MKACHKCGDPKDIELFYKCARRSDGRSNSCIACDKKYGKARRAANKGKPRWRDRNREQDRASNAAYHVKVTYGLSPEAWQEMFQKQGGRCANPGCRTDVPGGKANKFYVDHDHATGKVRGLLCWGCNIAAGHLRDDPSVIRGLAAYVEASGNV